jgi:DNA modification methylase
VKPYYDDGNVTIYHGDAAYVRLGVLDHAAVGALVTDPPYGVGDWRGKPRDFADDWGAVERFTENGVTWPMAMFANHESLARTLALVLENHERVRVVTWHKSNVNGAGGGGNPWLADVEFCVLGVPAWPARPWSGLVSAPRSTGNPEWQKRRPDAYLHPTQKPVGAMRHAIGALDFEGAVLDPFCGSGSTLVAAKQLGRCAIGIEIEERYCEIAAQRCAQDVLDFGTAA